MFIPLLFHWSSRYQLYVIVNKGIVVHFRSYGNRRRRFFRFIKQRNQNLVCFQFLHRYSLLRTLLPLPWKFWRMNAAWSPWTWAALFTVYFSTSGRFSLYSPSSRSRRINFGHCITNDFIWMGRRYYYKPTDYNTNFRWVYYRCASW